MIKLLKNRVFARFLQPEKSDGGIVLPECAANTQSTRLAEVVNVGSDVTEFAIGNKVIMDFSGGWVKLEGELLISAHENNVLAVLEEERKAHFHPTLGCYCPDCARARREIAGEEKSK